MRPPTPLRLALAQLNLHVGDLAGNLAALRRWTDRARDEGAELVLSVCEDVRTDGPHLSGPVTATAVDLLPDVPASPCHRGKALAVDQPSPDEPDVSVSPAHTTVVAAGILIQENPANLGSVAGRRFWCAGFRVPLRGGTGAPVRAVGFPRTGT
ncbi:hypothetical protein ACIRBZ_29630 [Streptomyces sp. NPDC094038]|uniref:hypothetical protein n=1 Tax=Streptomyces sp. NPDC094038 TaxID=3366055 RepID=UPI003814013F